jgi:hypothetical protein
VALTADEQRRCYLHLKVMQVNRWGVFVGNLPETNQDTHRLQTALDNVTANGETTVRALLTDLDAKRTAFIASDTRFQATRVGQIELNPKEWADRITQYAYLQRDLAATLDVLELVAGSGAQGPSREP